MCTSSSIYIQVFICRLRSCPNFNGSGVTFIRIAKRLLGTLFGYINYFAKVRAPIQLQFEDNAGENQLQTCWKNLCWCVLKDDRRTDARRQNRHTIFNHANNVTKNIFYFRSTLYQISTRNPRFSCAKRWLLVSRETHRIHIHQNPPRGCIHVSTLTPYSNPSKPL